VIHTQRSPSPAGSGGTGQCPVLPSSPCCIARAITGRRPFPSACRREERACRPLSGRRARVFRWRSVGTASQGSRADCVRVCLCALDGGKMQR
jgi:hypothetical protein